MTKISNFILHCLCGYHAPITDASGLVEVKTSAIPGGVPVYDTQEKKTITKKSLARPRIFKCPKCGRGVAVKKNEVDSLNKNVGKE